MDLLRIQEALRREQLDGWLFFDHHERDPLAYRVLGLHSARHVTRRWYYLIPANGDPRGLVHRIESGIIDALPGEKRKYSSWQEQHAELARLLKGLKRVAMQYSPLCAVPYVAMVDAGTIELVRAQGVDVVSSAELIQEFEACLNAEQFATHEEAGRRVDKVCAGAFRFIGEKLAAGVSEVMVRDWVRDQFQAAGMVTDSGPIVGVNGHAGDPHYEPAPETNLPIGPGDFVLIDMWAKLDQPDAIYYDITWTGFCGDVPDRVRQVFETVRDARDRAVDAVAGAVKSKREIRGFEVDDAARNYIRDKGFADRFVHRTGHSIGTEVHGTGANMDNLETHDERRILAGALFSVEPGIYLDDFGVRSEVNVFVTATSASTTGAVQRELVRIG
ncbi:MAG TPA: M24 family metallopeptidase [Bryobacteraceae bacterium]|jgi:Xaa-Pro aminopeptidase|nr:M24 family metallopeptidase [Bryobacteraceae bacterium]